jgi:Protein of unknown function (DUF3570)
VKRALPLALVLAIGSGAARADEPSLSGEDILGRAAPFSIESARVRFTHYDQDGHGYQSQAGPSPGLETLTVEQPQLEVVARQGKFTHRLWVPVDVITNASADAIDGWPPPDVVSQPSHIVEAASIDFTTSYQRDARTSMFFRGGFHIENPFRSWNLGIGGQRSFADDNTVIAASLNQVFDWLDRFTIQGVRIGRAERSSTNVNLSLTQLLSPTTIGYLGYGLTVQLGTLGNTWNAVPLADGTLGDERLPGLRHRHAFVARLAQALPWRGAVKGFYRFYVDNWGVVAHTLEAQLYQRLGPWFYLRANYRFHSQNSVDFFSIRAAVDAQLRTADSDLALFNAQTVGILAAVDVPFARRLRDLHFDFGYERYFRTNDLRVNMYTCAAGFLF